jgi:hypothetical protein
VEVGEMKWELDLRGEARDRPDTGHAPDAGTDIIEDGREGT